MKVFRKGSVALVAMPWAIFNRPSIALGALKGYLTRQDTAVACLHPYLDIAALLGPTTYHAISRNSWAGEALYGGLLFPRQSRQAARLFTRLLGRSFTPGYEELRSILASQLRQWLDDHQFHQLALLGFSIAFAQLPASLLAAREIKKRCPELPIVFGGSTCTPGLAISLLRNFPQVDYVIAGEGERPLSQLVSWLEGNAPFPQNGVWSRERQPKNGNDCCQEITPLDQLPLPDYRDYFSELATSSLTFIPELPIEFSRGCWWNRCTFCNLNQQWQGYRAKSAQRMQVELQQLKKHYQVLDFFFTDNALPVQATRQLCNTLGNAADDCRFFAEIRVLPRPEDYRLLARAGFRTIQIGIEALADSLLEKMGKGVKVMDNVLALKMAAAAGLQVEGNLILEFPGSSEEEVAQTMTVLEMLLPFQPLEAARFFLGYGSPVWQNPDRYGIKALWPHPYYRHIYPESLLANMEMLLCSYRGDRKRQQALWRPVKTRIRQWHSFHQHRQRKGPALTYRDGGNFIIIRQERLGRPSLHHRLSGMSRRIYLACEQPQSLKTLAGHFTNFTGEQLVRFLADLEQKKLLFHHNSLYLALAVRDMSTNWPQVE